MASWQVQLHSLQSKHLSDCCTSIYGQKKVGTSMHKGLLLRTDKRKGLAYDGTSKSNKQTDKLPFWSSRQIDLIMNGYLLFICQHNKIPMKYLQCVLHKIHCAGLASKIEKQPFFPVDLHGQRWLPHSQMKALMCRK